MVLGPTASIGLHGFAFLRGAFAYAVHTWLDYHRATLLTKCTGLTAAELKTRSVPPSTLSLLGLIRHMGEVEKWWFSVYLAGAPDSSTYCTDDNLDGDFLDVADADAEADFVLFVREVDAARAAAAGHELDEVVRSAGHNQGRQFNRGAIQSATPRATSQCWLASTRGQVCPATARA